MLECTRRGLVLTASPFSFAPQTRPPAVHPNDPRPPLDATSKLENAHLRLLLRLLLLLHPRRREGGSHARFRDRSVRGCSTWVSRLFPSLPLLVRFRAGADLCFFFVSSPFTQNLRWYPPRNRSPSGPEDPRQGQEGRLRWNDETVDAESNHAHRAFGQVLVSLLPSFLLSFSHFQFKFIVALLRSLLFAR